MNEKENETLDEERVSFNQQPKRKKKRENPKTKGERMKHPKKELCCN
jgi:hypothetical protein